MDHLSCLRVLPRPSCLALLKMWKSNQARYLVVHTWWYIHGGTYCWLYCCTQDTETEVKLSRADIKVQDTEIDEIEEQMVMIIENKYWFCETYQEKHNENGRLTYSASN